MKRMSRRAWLLLLLTVGCGMRRVTIVHQSNLTPPMYTCRDVKRDFQCEAQERVEAARAIMQLGDELRKLSKPK